jgi:hypothetical protein
MDRLTGPFNVEQIVFQLDISISDAIMNFQDSGFKVRHCSVRLSVRLYLSENIVLFVCLSVCLSLPNFPYHLRRHHELPGLRIQGETLFSLSIHVCVCLFVRLYVLI